MKIRNTPYLIQRIEKPSAKLSYEETPQFVSFYANGAKTKNPEDREILRKALPLDYMGSSEFEWGAVPDALIVMSDRSRELQERQFELGDHKVWILAPAGTIEESIENIKKMFEDDYAFRLKGCAYIRASLIGNERNYPGKDEFTGWLDLDNHWFLTSLKSQMNTMRVLMGI